MDADIHPIITLSGPPASGTSTIGNTLSSELEYEFISGGDIFRQIATEKDLTLGELTELSEQDDSIDKELDERLRHYMREFYHTGSINDFEQTDDGVGLVIESRLAGWHAQEISSDIFTVFLNAPRDVRIERITDRTETIDELTRREESERQRYIEYYDVDFFDESLYDLCLETDTVSVDTTLKKIVNNSPYLTE